MDASLRYVTAEEYSTICPDGEAEKQLQQAEHDIDSLTYNRIIQKGMDGLTEFQKGIIKRAVCLQADFLHDYGEMLNNPLASYGINGVSMAWDKSVLIRKGSVYTTNGVYGLLQQTGLTYRGLDWRP